MSATATGAPLSAARVPVLRALIDEARRKGYTQGVLGVRARPEWTGAADFIHDGAPVRVVPCVSTLAVREALLGRVPDSYLVVLTDRDPDDLGVGVMAHLIGHRLRTPDPWEAVRQRFAATGLEGALISVPSARDIATGLLQAEPPHGWPAAVGGVLTRDHAYTALARHHVQWPETADLLGILTWTAQEGTTNRLADLRAGVGPVLTEALLDWMAGAAPALRAPLRHLLASGTIADAIPLGLVSGVLAEAREGHDVAEAGVAREALARLEARIGSSRPPLPALVTWAAEAAIALDAMDLGTATRIRARADEALRQAGAEGLAVRSTALPAGLTARLIGVAEAARAVALVPGADRLAEVEARWAALERHRLAGRDPRVVTIRAALRLARWLSAPEGALPAAAPFGAHLVRHRDVEAWVDAAANDIHSGIGDPLADVALGAVLTAVRERRHRSDTEFAAALARHTRLDPAPTSPEGAEVPLVEDFLADVVIPLARTTPVLLLVLDGMSAAVATDVVADITGPERLWAEALPAGSTRRGAVLAVLPTLTTASRTSLLCGQLAVGTQSDERRGYTALATAHGIVGAELFHKKPLDSSRPGFAVADDVGAAITDTSGRQLVTCVLNTVDDALDRSDPGGTFWGADAVRHLEPLLRRAEHAGRTVVLVSDHGHVIERRQGRQCSFPVTSSNRSRTSSPPAGEGEVLVEGRRVLLSDGSAVLAVDERLRYGPLKAGYHGGGSPAEAVIPGIVLVPGLVPERTGLRLAPPQSPPWWSAPLLPVAPAVTAPIAVPEAVLAPTDDGALFDLQPAQGAPLVDALSPGAVPGMSHDVARLVIASPTWAAQRAAAPRVSISDDAVVSFLAALLATPSRRLPPVAAATALGVPEVSVRGSVRHAQQLLNVEGYVVIGIDQDGTTMLSEALMREQFELDG